jgi:Type IV secretion system pilin
VQIGPINPDPTLLGGASGLVMQVLGLVMYISLVACVIAGLAAGGMIAVGGVSRNVEMRSAGMRGLIYSIVGVVVIGSILVVMNTVFSRAHS